MTDGLDSREEEDEEEVVMMSGEVDARERLAKETVFNRRAASDTENSGPVNVSDESSSLTGRKDVRVRLKVVAGSTANTGVDGEKEELRAKETVLKVVVPETDANARESDSLTSLRVTVYGVVVDERREMLQRAESVPKRTSPLR